MLIFSTKGKITTDNDKTNLIHRFDVPNGVKSLTIKYSYSPKTLENREKAAAVVRSCFEKYDEQLVGRPADYFPVKNLITLSADENGSYRGCAHRQANEQMHILSEEYASPGFIRGRINEGEWDIVLNVHSISCDVEYTVIVEGDVQ